MTQESFDDQERHGALDCDTGLTVRALTICAAVIQKQEWWCQKLGTLKIWRPDSFCAVQWPCGGSVEFFYRSVERFMPLPHGASVNICAWFLLPLPRCCHAATALLPHCRYVIIPATQTGFSVIIIRRKSKSLNENIENLWHLEPFLSVQFQTAALLTWCSCGGVVFFHVFFFWGEGGITNFVVITMSLWDWFLWLLLGFSLPELFVPFVSCTFVIFLDTVTESELAVCFIHARRWVRFLGKMTRKNVVHEWEIHGVSWNYGMGNVSVIRDFENNDSVPCACMCVKIWADEISVCVCVCVFMQEKKKGVAC